MRSGLLVLGVTGSVVLACGGAAMTMPGSEAEAFVRDRVGGSTTLLNRVECPEEIVLKAGSEWTCTAAFEDGTQSTFRCWAVRSVEFDCERVLSEP